MFSDKFLLKLKSLDFGKTLKSLDILNYAAILLEYISKIQI